MKSYKVSARVVEYHDVEVEADSVADAIEKAKENGFESDNANGTDTHVDHVAPCGVSQ
jgi:hypothetical protein|tara:strand:+ start:239 stop:412 length:174 start_codon:yes stop_codon:yes gene_type:complete